MERAYRNLMMYFIFKFLLMYAIRWMITGYVKKNHNDLVAQMNSLNAKTS
jgi:hypothetical protein